MRTVTLGSNDFDVRPLKRKEVKQLRKDGITLVNLDPAKGEEAMDRVFDMVFTPDQIAVIDELDNPDALKLWSAVLKETYGAQDEEKNS
ncbi:hypothetical protein [Desulfosarcina ovata]|uniref:Uncharacterized protein n=1 Tax=Desulfosarcina ovata subsp. ovata TaxID=2752305 RepID=A0A5K8AHE0_9BACT|nr:hypothetical protein [Desulfosarcina ovata]BBO92051.1 hypothetical protein DSCOOX_52310 [Desulfosarcina ovata subsp. ovata]